MSEPTPTPERRPIPGFRQCPREFWSHKTNWTGLIAIITAVVAWQMGEMSTTAALTQGLGGLSLLFIRDALAGGR